MLSFSDILHYRKFSSSENLELRNIALPRRTDLTHYVRKRRYLLLNNPGFHTKQLFIKQYLVKQLNRRKMTLRSAVSNFLFCTL